MPVSSSPTHSRIARRMSAGALAVASVATTAVPVEEVRASSSLLPAQAAACPAPVLPGQLVKDQELHGLTVDEGTTPEPFEATVIGRIVDGIAPGLDMIVVRTSSDAITDAHGIWFGMSGSPVYTDQGLLVGAVAYGLAGASPIAGITPATEMYKLLRGGSPAVAAPNVELTATLEAQIVDSGAATAQQAAAGLRRLPIPVAVSGTTPARLRRVTRLIERHVDGVRVYPAGRASARPSAVELEPGGNVAAAVSHGDTTFAAVGTVTAVCEGQALLFGHPFLWNGATNVAAHQATAVLVQPDPIFGSFKVANVGDPVGTVDQDRLAGLHVDLGEVPTSARVRSALAATDTGASRTARTRVVVPEFLPDVAATHVLSNLDRVHDRIGPGVVTLRWGASGTRANGTPWSFRRREKLADPFDAAFTPAFKIFDDLARLFFNPFQPITIDRVTVSGTIDPAYAEAQLIRLERRGPKGGWQPVSRRTPLQLVAGTEVRLRGVLRSVRSTRLTRVPLSITVPRWAGSRGGLTVSAGLPFFFEEGPSGPQPASFDQLLAAIDHAPTGDTLRAELRLVRGVPGGGRQRVTRAARATAPTAISGALGFVVEVVAAPPAR